MTLDDCWKDVVKILRIVATERGFMSTAYARVMGLPEAVTRSPGLYPVWDLAVSAREMQDKLGWLHDKRTSYEDTCALAANAIEAHYRALPPCDIPGCNRVVFYECAGMMVCPAHREPCCVERNPK